MTKTTYQSVTYMKDLLADAPVAQKQISEPKGADGRPPNRKTQEIGEPAKGRQENTKTGYKTKSSADVASSVSTKNNTDSRTGRGITPIKAMVSAFSPAVDYRTYRLRNPQEVLTRRKSLGMFHLKQQVDGLHPSLDVFDGPKPIRLLAFRAILCDTFDMLGTSESSEVHVLAYFLDGEAKDVHAELLGLFEIDFEEAGSPVQSDHGSCPHVIHALLPRLLSDDVLREPPDAVSRSEQREEKDLGGFAEPISKAARQFRHIFSKDELVNFYLQGFRTSIREMVGHQVCDMTQEDRQSLSAVRQLACAVGRSRRALISKGRQMLRPPTDANERPKRAFKPVMMMPQALDS